MAIRRPMLTELSYNRSEYGEPETYRFVPATIRAENSNAVKLALLSYTPSMQKGPGIPGGTSLLAALTNFSPIE